MRRLSHLLLLCPLSVACSEYDILGEKEDNPPQRNDTGVPEEEDSEVVIVETAEPLPECQGRIFDEHSVPMIEACAESSEPVGTFTPTVEWEKATWTVQPGSSQVMMMPAVGSFNDDDGDGDADEDDIPDVVVVTYGSSDVIRVVSGDGSGTEILNIAGTGVQGQGGVALGDIDGDGWQDIVIPTTSRTIAVYDHLGNRMWVSASLGGALYGTSDNPAIADMDGDGSPEIICGAAILSSTGAVLGKGTAGIGGVNGANVGTASFAYDIDDDGVQEVVVGNALYDITGATIWNNGLVDGYPAVGNFDSDTMGEIVVTSGGKIRLQDDNGTKLCETAIPGAGSAYYGGPPTVADFDGDGEAEFAAAAGSRYSVFEKDCSVKWQATTQDASSGNTGSSVFDFEGDGVAEAVYADETKLWVFAGPDGAVKLSDPHHSNATWLEYPAIADVDGDNQAEIIVANTAYMMSYSGFTVFGDASSSWRPGRKIWNQHAYSITNVNDDGSIPAVADRNLEYYNNFRSGALNVGSDLPARPDLYVTIEDVCIDECVLDRLLVWVSVTNQGYQDITDDVPLTLTGTQQDGTAVELYSTIITDVIPAGQALQAYEILVESGASAIVSLSASIDGGNSGVGAILEECDELNNDSVWAGEACLAP